MKKSLSQDAQKSLRRLDWWLSHQHKGPEGFYTQLLTLADKGPHCCMVTQMVLASSSVHHPLPSPHLGLSPELPSIPPGAGEP